MKILALSLVSLFLVSCASINQMSGRGIVKSQISKFDGTRSVIATPNYVKGMEMELGLFWTETNPSKAIITAAYKTDTQLHRFGAGPLYTKISGIRLNVDGKIMNFNSTTGTRLSSSPYNRNTQKIDTSSEANILVPLSVVKQMVAARDCRVSVTGTDGYGVGMFHVESFASIPTAKVNFREALQKIGR